MYVFLAHRIRMKFISYLEPMIHMVLAFDDDRNYDSLLIDDSAKAQVLYDFSNVVVVYCRCPYQSSLVMHCNAPFIRSIIIINYLSIRHPLYLLSVCFDLIFELLKE